MVARQHVEHRHRRGETAIRPTSLQPTCAPARRRWSPRLPSLTVLAPGAVRSSRPHRDAAEERRGRPESPDEVVLEFQQGVDASLGSLRVFDGQGVQVDSGGGHAARRLRGGGRHRFRARPGHVHGGVARGLGRLGPDLGSAFVFT